MNKLKEKFGEKQKKNCKQAIASMMPALIVAVIVVVSVTTSTPVLSAVPDRLEYEENQDTKHGQASESGTDTDGQEELVDSVEDLLNQESTMPARESFTEPAAYKDGTYSGEASGFGGSITVQVTISGGKISHVAVTSASGETPSFLSKAMAVTSRIVSSNSPNVDVVSGATYTSTGIINATKRALKKAAADGTSVSTDEETIEPTQQPQMNPAVEPDNLPDKTITDFTSVQKPGYAYKDGTYQGTGVGFGGDISLQITISKGYISGIKVLSASKETPSYFNKALEILDRILVQQSPDVDVVSGATFSSEGMIEAVQKALEQAVVNDSEQPSEGLTPEQPENGDCGETDTNTGEENPEETGPFSDGLYYASVSCNNSEEEDADVYFDYILDLVLEIKKGRVVGLTASRSQDKSENPAMNDRYIDYALNGRSNKNYKGIAQQLIERQTREGLDIVSGATYSSRAIIQGVENMLTSAGE